MSTWIATILAMTSSQLGALIASGDGIFAVTSLICAVTLFIQIKVEEVDGAGETR